MATYKGIKGVKVESRASDPTASASTAGTIWYNTATTALKYAIEGAGAWSAGNALNQPREELAGARNGTTTAALVFGGNYPGAGYADQTETYDGTSWTEVNDMIRGRSQPGGLGIQTAAMAVGGNYPTDTNYDEMWDGTCWTEVADTTTWRVAGQATGTTTAGIISGGSSPSFGGVKCETWDGTSWTEVNDLSRSAPGAGYGTSCGTTTAALYAGGGSPAGVDLNETWDGTSWTEANDLTTARYGAEAMGITTAALVVGGISDPVGVYAVTEKYDGTSWTEVGDLGTARKFLGGGGTTTAGLVAGGGPYGTPLSGLTEEWSDPVYTIKTVTVS
jgi:hypothetical protein